MGFTFVPTRYARQPDIHANADICLTGKTTGRVWAAMTIEICGAHICGAWWTCVPGYFTWWLITPERDSTCYMSNKCLSEIAYGTVGCLITHLLIAHIHVPITPSWLPLSLMSVSSISSQSHENRPRDPQNKGKIHTYNWVRDTPYPAMEETWRP